MTKKLFALAVAFVLMALLYVSGDKERGEE